MIWAYNMRTIAVLAVVILHVSAIFVGGVTLDDESYGNNIWWAGNIFDSITRWCVPIFVTISGYFLLNNQDAPAVFFKKRVKKILTPLIFWSVFFSLWTALKYIVKGDINLSHISYEILKNFILGRPYFHLWYLFMIPFLYIFTPYLKVLLHNLERNIVLIFIWLAFTLAASHIIFNNLVTMAGFSSSPSLFANNFLLYIGYFMLGGYINKFEITLKNKLLIPLVLAAWIITILGSYYFGYQYFYSYLSVNTILASIGVFFIIKNSGSMFLSLNGKKLASYSFGIYLIHPIYLDIINFLLSEDIVGNFNPFIYIPVTSIIIFILSLLSAIFIKKLPYFRHCI